jgi:hypothetical protein
LGSNRDEISADKRRIGRGAALNVEKVLTGVKENHKKGSGGFEALTRRESEPLATPQ